uniref:MIF4G domain containing b n=1 Tax=Sinocyclocheilus grahami TaxID=75366 RepID=A0A672NML9_SINGR
MSYVIADFSLRALRALSTIFTRAISIIFFSAVPKWVLVNVQFYCNCIVALSFKGRCIAYFFTLFCLLQVNNMPMMALVHPVYDCLFRLAQSDALKNEEEVDCLVLQLHRIGDQLEKMNLQLMDELFNLLRDGFLLQEDLSSMGHLLLLEILEFRAGGWTLSETAQKYYYSEVTD